MRPPFECEYQVNQKNLKVNSIYGIGDILVLWFQRIFKRCFTLFEHGGILVKDQESSEYDQEIQLS